MSTEVTANPQHKKSLLIIAYYFPPLGGIGVQRVLKFTRYLPQFGWRPVVLTVKGSPYPLQDSDLMNQLPSDLELHRALTLEPWHLYKHVKKVIPARKQAAKPNDAENRGSQPSQPSLAARLSSWVFIPDEYIGWIPFAIRLGKQVIRREKPAAIFSTSAPYSAHLIAKSLAHWSKLPWVMDLRDPWVNNPFMSFLTRFHRSLTTSLEAGCIRQADQVISVTPYMTDDLRDRYPNQPAEKFVTITNGFDAADFESDIQPDPQQFTIRHVGSLYGQRSALPFLNGLILALERNPALKDVLKVEFIGLMDQANQQAWTDFISAHQLQPWVSQHPFVPHRQAIRLMQQSQIQLLIPGQGQHAGGIYTGKLFEYLGTQRPILAIAHPGVAPELLNQLEAGIVASPDAPDQIAAAILIFFVKFQNGQLGPILNEKIQAFERRCLTERLAHLMDQLPSRSAASE